MSGSFRAICKISGVARTGVSLLCFYVFAMAFGGNAARAAQWTPGGASSFASRFAIADFDGDQKPDLATVQVDQDDAIGTRYSIRLQLSAGEESAIGITGPRGGLELVARDVNGDDLVDLVVTTAIDSHFVAVLLNDGHGKFTLAKPGAFPSIESDEGIRLAAAREPAEECTALQFAGSTFGIEALDDAGTGPEQKSRFSASGDGDANWAGVELGRPGRSPPFPVFHS